GPDSDVDRDMSEIFFFQAEDGIRDFHVTGVQTCALPICPAIAASGLKLRAALLKTRLPCRSAFLACTRAKSVTMASSSTYSRSRSEERRVGRECRGRGTGAEVEAAQPGTTELAKCTTYGI